MAGQQFCHLAGLDCHEGVLRLLRFSFWNEQDSAGVVLRNAFGVGDLRGAYQPCHALPGDAQQALAT